MPVAPQRWAWGCRREEGARSGGPALRTRSMGSHKGQQGVSSSVPNPGSTQAGLEVREEGDDDKESSDVLGSQLEGGLDWQG